VVVVVEVVSSSSGSRIRSGRIRSGSSSSIVVV